LGVLLHCMNQFRFSSAVAQFPHYKELIFSDKRWKDATFVCGVLMHELNAQYTEWAVSDSTHLTGRKEGAFEGF